MKLVDKVKNFFYEDVDDEDIRPEKIKPDKVKEEKPKKEKKEFFIKKEPKVTEETQRIEIDYEETPNDGLSERELFRSERTFNFPVDMEDEVTSSFTEEEKDEFFGPTSRLKIEEERTVSEPEVKSKFRPSPVVSPVYGILDKDYNVDDVEEINKGDDHSLNKKISDYDTVRNKAYKEMDEELEKTLNERKSIFYNLDEKEEDVAISYGEENTEAKEVEIPETRVKKNKKVVEESSEDEIKTDTNELFNLLDNVTTDEYDDDDE
jgi:hypothetical protein